LEWGTSRTYLS